VRVAYLSRMATVVIKTIKGRQYRYFQSTYRSGGKVRTNSKYIGPVGGGKRKRSTSVSDVLMNVFTLGVKAAAGELKERHYAKRRAPSHRSKHVADKATRELDRLYGLDRSTPERWRETWERLRANTELFNEWRQQQETVTNELHAEKARQQDAAPKSAEEKQLTASKQEFADRVNAHIAAQHARHADQDARQTSQDAPQAAQEAPAKDFTVDDEIEAREAKFDAMQEEVNAARGFNPAPTDPPDIPSPEPDDAPAPDDGPQSESGQGPDAGPGSEGEAAP
jgi:hypothetical protein